MKVIACHTCDIFWTQFIISTTSWILQIAGLKKSFLEVWGNSYSICFILIELHACKLHVFLHVSDLAKDMFIIENMAEANNSRVSNQQTEYPYGNAWLDI